MHKKLKNLKKYTGYFFKYWKEIGLKNTLILTIYKFLPRKMDLPGVGIEVFDIGNYKEETKGMDFSVAPEDKATIPFVWYVPYWTNVWGGGHLTLFRFADMLHKMGNPNYLYIYNIALTTAQQLEADLQRALPGTQIRVLTDPKDMPAKHVALATTWQSAFEVVKHSKLQRKMYFMQDYESVFYAWGTQSIQANASYELGFPAITGGTWLKSCYEKHAGPGTANNYVFSVDKTIFYARKDLGSEIKKLFFYGRPSTERRAHELGIAALREIHKKYPHIEIVIAGLDGLAKTDFPSTMLGNLTLAQTGELYRTCDVGMALSATNCSYLPVELMACGVPVLTNNGPQSEWFCENEINSLTCDPFPSAFVRALDRLVESRELRVKIAEGGLATIAKTTWQNEAEKIHGYIHAAM